MSTPLLQTKLYLPPARPELVARPRLIERLNAGLARKLILVSAPAGFGKTTLLSEWIQAMAAAPPPIAVAWLSLDEGDNDPVRFLAYLIAALQTTEADLGRSALSALQSPQPPPVEAILTVLINELATVPTPLILVLDDYHLIQAQSVHDTLAFLLDHLPPQMHLAIVTRADPPLPVARLRARRQLVELRQADLRFTPDEVARFLNQVMGLGLSAEDVAALDARTEGWIVGLQLAALSLQDRPDAHEFIAAFTGSHHYVLEYLVEEVVRRHPEPVQRFLIQTSILSRMCGALCDALTDRTDGEAMLAHLWRRNLFILPLDDEHHWYRYHHLFADLLTNLLRQGYPTGHIQDLHLRACGWYDRNGWTNEAVRHALAAQDYERVAQLIERHSLAMVTRGELTTVLRWIDALPDSLARSRPWLCIHQAWPLTFAGKTEPAQGLLLQVERQVSLAGPTPESEQILGHVAAMRAMLAVIGGDMPRAMEQAHRADELLPPDNSGPRSIIPFALASAYYAKGDLVRASQALAEELRLGQAAGNLWTIVRSRCDLADLRIIQGQLCDATELCQEALQIAEERGARQFGTVGYVLVKLGELSYERGDLATAKDLVSEGVDLMQGWQQPYEMVVGYTTLSAILQALDDVDGAMEALQNAVAIQARHPNYYKVNSLIRLYRVRLALAQDDPEDAARQAAEVRLGATENLLFREQEQIVLARVLTAQAKWDESLRLLTRLATDAERGRRFGRLTEILALQAVALWRKGNTDQALTALDKALTIGEPEGYARVFVEQGAPMTGLLQQAAAHGIAPDYVSGLLAALGAKEVERAPAAAAPAAASLVEPLTDRELEVLQLLGAGYSNRRISETLVITLNTVKKHTSGIYGKLGVHSRTQAVVRAQELGLL